MITNADRLKAAADHLGIPPRSIDDAANSLSRCESQSGKAAAYGMARLMLRHGRLSEAARRYVESFLAG